MLRSTDSVPRPVKCDLRLLFHERLSPRGGWWLIDGHYMRARIRGATKKRYMVAHDALLMAGAEPFSAPKGETWLVQSAVRIG